MGNTKPCPACNGTGTYVSVVPEPGIIEVQQVRWQEVVPA